MPKVLYNIFLSLVFQMCSNQERKDIMQKLEEIFNLDMLLLKNQFALLFEDAAPSLFQYFSINSEHSGTF